jgi:hypothetical protein
MGKGRHTGREMGPLRPAAFPPPNPATVKRLREVAERRGLDFQRDVAPRLYDHPGELFVNEVYQVIRERLGGWWHLSIKPLTRERHSRWRDYQRIKTELVGPEHEGVELFPAESRLVDTADQYHLWVAADPAYRFPFGFDEGRSVSGA